MFVIAKKIKELFARTFNGNSARVRCVSSTTVVINIMLLDWLRRKRTKHDNTKRRNLKLVTFFALWNNTH